MNPENLIQKARHSSFYRKILNIALWKMVPFNKPHRIVVHEIGDKSVTTKLPYRKSNHNHIKGLHACGLATLAEFTTGMQLLRSLDSRQYRIIMRSINMEYHYQGKSNAYATFQVSEDWLKSQVVDPLKETDKIEIEVVVDVSDEEQNRLATGKIIWQIKDWKKVKTKQ